MLIRRQAAAAASIFSSIFFLAFSAWIYNPMWERAFRSDNSPASWLSSALLLTLSVSALRLVVERQISINLGVWASAAFFMLALDEQFMFHELWKYRCEEWFSLCQYHWAQHLPIFSIGILGTLTALLLHREFPDRLMRSLLWIGILVGSMAITINQVHMPYPIAELEEAFEVLAESLVLASFVSAAKEN